MTDPACADPWHHDATAPHLTYHDDIGKDWTAESYGCRTCGFRTMIRETYIPIPATCQNCGTTFESMPPPHTERLCADCWRHELDEYFANQEKP